MKNQVKVFATIGSKPLAEEICGELERLLPPALLPAGGLMRNTKVDKFSNENIQVQADDVFQSTAVVIHTQASPVNDGIIELFALLDAIINSKPANILLVFPYMPFSRSDRKNKAYVSTLGYRLPHILTHSFGIRHALLLDPHDSHIKHYFTPAADEVTAVYLLADYIKKNIFPIKQKDNCVIVFGDAGAAKAYGKMAHALELHAAYIDKDRPDDNESPDSKKVVGDVSGKDCLIVDDEILSGKTILHDTRALLNAGAKSVSVFAVHPICADKSLPIDGAVKNLDDSPVERIVVTDSIPIKHKLANCKKFTVLPVAPLLAEAISKILQGEPIYVSAQAQESVN